MITILKETTGTVDGFRYPENIYYVDQKKGKLHAFINENGEKKEFEKPLTFDKRRRTFDVLGKMNEFFFVLPSALKEKTV